MSINREEKLRNVGARLRQVGWLALGLVAPAFVALGNEPAASPAYHVLIEPKFLRPPVSISIPGAKRTVFAAGVTRLAGESPEYMSRGEIDSLKVNWDRFMPLAIPHATNALRKLKPQFTRDRKKVIEFAELFDETQLVASTVLSPEFLPLFEEAFGPELIVAIPSRYQIFVFPALASAYEEYAPMVTRAYKSTPHPVSLEVFKVNSAGIRAIGTYDDP